MNRSSARRRAFFRILATRHAQHIGSLHAVFRTPFGFCRVCNSVDDTLASFSYLNEQRFNYQMMTESYGAMMGPAA